MRCGSFDACRGSADACELHFGCIFPESVNGIGMLQPMIRIRANAFSRSNGGVVENRSGPQFRQDDTGTDGAGGKERHWIIPSPKKRSPGPSGTI